MEWEWEWEWRSSELVRRRTKATRRQRQRQQGADSGVRSAKCGQRLTTCCRLTRVDSSVTTEPSRTPSRRAVRGVRVVRQVRAAVGVGVTLSLTGAVGAVGALDGCLWERPGSPVVRCLCGRDKRSSLARPRSLVLGRLPASISCRAPLATCESQGFVKARKGWAARAG